MVIFYDWIVSPKSKCCTSAYFLHEITVKVFLPFIYTDLHLYIHVYILHTHLPA